MMEVLSGESTKITLPDLDPPVNTKNAKELSEGF